MRLGGGFKAFNDVLRLEKQGDVVALVALLRSTEIAAGVALRGAAADSLRRLGARDAAPEIAHLLRDPSTDVRTMAVRALATLASNDVIPQVVETLDDPDPAIAALAARALGAIGSREAVTGLSTVFFDDGNAGGHRAAVRREAAYALGKIRHRETVPALAIALNDPHWTVRRAAIWALARTECPESVTALEQATIRHPITWLRSRLARRGLIDRQRTI